MIAVIAASQESGARSARTTLDEAAPRHLLSTLHRLSDTELEADTGGEPAGGTERASVR